MNAPLDRRPTNPAAVARRVALLYAACGSAWLLLADWLVRTGITDVAARARATAAIEWLTVAVSAVVVYRLAHGRRDARPPASAARDDSGASQEVTSRLLLAIVAATPDVIYAKDRQGRYLLFSAGAERLFGRTSAQVLGKDVGAVLPADQAALVRRNDEEAMGEDREMECQECVDTVDGPRTFLSIRGPLHDAAGRVVGLQGISRDISETLLARGRLADSEERFRMLFDSNPVPMWLFDRASSRFLHVNRAAIARYGYTAEEFAGLTVADLLPESDDRHLDTMLADRTANASGAQPMPPLGSSTHRAKDGSPIDVEVSVTDLQFDGRRARVVAALDVTSTKAQERHIRASASLLADVLARVGDGFIALDGDGRFTYVNARGAELLGHAGPDGLIGRNARTILGDAIGPSFLQAYEQALLTQRPAVFEDRSAQRQRWIENRIYPSAGGLSIYLTDVTARKTAEQALQASEKRYRLAAARVQVWDWTAATGRMYVSAEFWRELGAPQVGEDETFEALGRLVHADDVVLLRAAIRAHLTKRTRYDVEFRARHVDGSWKWFHTQGQAVWDADGRATYMAGTTFDITRRKQAEQSLRDAEAYRRNVFDQLGDGVLLIDRDQRFTDANPRALEMLGYEHDELLALTAADVIAGFERDRLAGATAAIMRGEPYVNDWILVRKDGSEFPVEVSARALDDARHVAVVRDISVRRGAEVALQTYRVELSELTQRLLSQERRTMRKIAQALHDHLGQTLGAARLYLDAYRAAHDVHLRPDQREPGNRVALLLDQAVGEVRLVLADLRPPLLETQGLVSALETEVGSIVVTSRDVDVLLEVDEGASRLRWPPDVEYAAFMIVREAIANAQQHARASLVRVALGGDAASLDVQVIDDGDGIAMPMVHGRAGHLGIVGMRERANVVGAVFSLGRGATGTRAAFRWEAPAR